MPADGIWKQEDDSREWVGGRGILGRKTEAAHALEMEMGQEQ